MKNILLLLISIVILSACDNDVNPQIAINLQPMNGTTPVGVGDIIQTDEGRNFNIREIRFYIDNLKLIKTDNSTIEVADLIFIDWPEKNATLELPFGDYSGIEFHLGMDSITNESNPIDFAPEHPLSNQQDMHWGMLKYRFLTFVGKVDTAGAGNGTPENLLQYHLGNNRFYQKVEIDKNFTIDANSSSLDLLLQVKAMFDGPAGEVDIRTHRTNHSGEAVLDKGAIMMGNFAAALELK